MTDAFEYSDIDECEISPQEAIKRLNVRGRPPRIKWGRYFEEWTDLKKISHLKKFGEAMNYAAEIKQREFVELCGIAQRQEEQLIQAKRLIDQQTAAYNREIAHLNEQMQDMAAEIAKGQEPMTKARRILKMGKKKTCEPDCTNDAWSCCACRGTLLEFVDAAIEALSDGG